MGNRKYSELDFINAVMSSTSIRQTLIKLNISPKGGNYRSINNYIKKLNLDTSHFLGQAHNKGKNFGPKRPISDYLSNEHFITSHKLRLRLIAEGYFEHKCQKCNNTKWENELVPLELHHVDGNHKNNNLSNIQLLCPNCHSLTNNFRNKKPKKDKINRKNYNINSKTHLRKTYRPEYEILIQEVQQYGYCATGRKYNVSDNAIRKWIKHYEKHQKLGSALPF
jgi:Zn finger protein HypA/HybF involved in hydrogenase expression